jgi:hypothetical protein
MISGSASIAMSGSTSESSGRLRTSRAVLYRIIDCPFSVTADRDIGVVGTDADRSRGEVAARIRWCITERARKRDSQANGFRR